MIDENLVDEFLQYLAETRPCPDPMRERVDALCDAILVLPVEQQTATVVYYWRRMREIRELKERVH